MRCEWWRRERTCAKFWRYLRKSYCKRRRLRRILMVVKQSYFRVIRVKYRCPTGPEFQTMNVVYAALVRHWLIYCVKVILLAFWLHGFVTKFDFKNLACSTDSLRQVFPLSLHFAHVWACQMIWNRNNESDLLGVGVEPQSLLWRPELTMGHSNWPMTHVTHVTHDPGVTARDSCDFVSSVRIQIYKTKQLFIFMTLAVANKTWS
jgi:hypothetical protein